MEIGDEARGEVDATKKKHIEWGLYLQKSANGQVQLNEHRRSRVAANLSSLSAFPGAFVVCDSFYFVGLTSFHGRAILPEKKPKKKKTQKTRYVAKPRTICLPSIVIQVALFFANTILRACNYKRKCRLDSC